MVASNCLQRVCVMESCDFVPSLFSAGKYKIAKKQQPLIKLKIAIFYTRCCKIAVFYFHNFCFFRTFQFFFEFNTLSINSKKLNIQNLREFTQFRFSTFCSIPQTFSIQSLSDNSQFIFSEFE